MGFGSGFVRGGNQLTPSQINTIPVFNVMDPLYGAKGNGVTDDTAAIQAAAAQWVAAQKGTLYFPAGVYKCSAASDLLTINYVGMSVEGDGKGSSVLQPTSALTGDLIRWTTLGNQAKAGRIRGLQIDMSNAGAGACGLHVGDIIGHRLDDFYVYNIGGSGADQIGIHFDNVTNWTEESTWVGVFVDVVAAGSVGVLFDKQSGGGASWGYNTISCYVGASGGSVGVQFNTGGRYYNGQLCLTGNLGGAGTVGINLVGTAEIDQTLFAVTMEGSGAAGPIGLQMSSTSVLSGAGTVDLSQSVLTNSNGGIGNIDFIGWFNCAGIAYSASAPPNLLSAADASLNTGIGSWLKTGAGTVVQSAALPLFNGYALQFTGNGVGAASAASGFYPVAPGKNYSATASVLAATTPQTWTIALGWFTSAGVAISTSTGSGEADNDTGLTVISFLSVTAPSNAAYVEVKVQTGSTPANGEIHYVGLIGLFAGASAVWTDGGPPPSIPLTALPVSGQLAADVNLPATAATLVFTTPSLGVGTWLLTAGVTVLPGATASLTGCEMYAGVGTATATFGGQPASQTGLVVSSVAPIELDCMVTVTVAGTITITIYNNDAVAATAKASTTGTAAKAGASGYTAVRVA